MYFELSPHAFQIAFMISHLVGRARAWATIEWARESLLCNSLWAFKDALWKTVDPVSSEREKAREQSGHTDAATSVALQSQPPYRLGEDCEGKCLKDTTTGRPTTVINTVSTHPVTESLYSDLTSVPTCYHHLK